jgi:hypothetical protein
MARHDQETQQNATSKDQESDNLAAALARLKDPPKAEALIGSVVSAGQTASTAHATPASQAAPPKTPQVNQKKKHSPKGKLSPTDIAALAKLVQRKEAATQSPEPPSQLIAPTNPDADATIAAHVAEKQREADAVAAVQEAEKWHVEKAQIKEPVLGKHRLYILLGLWLAAVPLALVLYAVISFVASSALHGALGTLIMLPMYALGIYGLVGWIPLVLLYMKTQKG